MDELEELARLLKSARWKYVSMVDEDGHPDGGMFEQSSHEVADAILAAGYRKPQQVTTEEELDALPVGSVLRTEDGAWEKVSDPDDDDDITFWLQAGNRRWNPSRDVALPATVLHVATP